MKTKIPTLTLGFVLGAISVLLLGQSRPPQPAGRYCMIETPSGVCVQDTSTGAVKLIPGLLLKGMAESGPTSLPFSKLTLGESFGSTMP